MNLTALINLVDLSIQAGESWAIYGPEAETFGGKLPAAIHPFSPEIAPGLDGLLLVGALSTGSPTETEAWLRPMVAQLKEAARLVVIDWQADGPLNSGPNLNHRLKKGRLCRLLGQAGFGRLETLAHQPSYYIVHGVKTEPPLIPQAGCFVNVAGLEELSKNSMKPVELFGCQLIVANTGQEIVAFARHCPHAGSPLDQGLLRRRSIVCPLHGYIWDVYTGEPVEPDDEDILPRYTVRVDPERGRILVALVPLEA